MTHLKLSYANQIFAYKISLSSCILNRINDNNEIVEMVKFGYVKAKNHSKKCFLLDRENYSRHQSAKNSTYVKLRVAIMS